MSAGRTAYTTDDGHIVVPPRQRPDRWGDPRQHTSHVLGVEVIEALGSMVAVLQVAEMVKRLRFGLSSAGLVRWAILEPSTPYDPSRWRWPSDWDDLERCELAYALAPNWLQHRMADQLRAFREHVAGRCASSRRPPDHFEAAL